MSPSVQANRAGPVAPNGPNLTAKSRWTARLDEPVLLAGFGSLDVHRDRRRDCRHSAIRSLGLGSQPNRTGADFTG